MAEQSESVEPINRSAHDATMEQEKSIVEAQEQKPEMKEQKNDKEKEKDKMPEIISENAVTPKSVKNDPEDEDLEDGEIDDDDENDEPVLANDSKPANAAIASAAAPVGLGKPAQASPVRNVDEPVKKSKSKKHQTVDDDFAGAIQSAIAAALKKDGIMPPKPKLSENREEIEKHSDKDSSVSKSSRRRKRRKLRDDRERDKDRKKHRTSSPDTTHLPAHGHPPDDDLDDDEMLCVRGGSPPPAGFMPSHPSLLDADLPAKKEGYDSDESYSSYDSYDSSHNYGRYSSSRKKDLGSGSGSRSKRKERVNRRDDDRRTEKRSRRNYDDSGGEDKYQDRHPQQPRKLELCKFYLMECCAKKDKCSYMHSDFPCKYYYLGMECIYRSACKFSHGKPLTDQLRSVLLKHLETAPKEILGTFRRISRENALNLMNATHERICADNGVENTLASPTMTTQSVVQAQAGCNRNTDMLPQQMQMQQQLQTGQNEIIPSLLDMVINIPPATGDSQAAAAAAAAQAATTAAATANMKSDKQRKSRWCDTPMINTVPSKQSNLEPPSINAPSYLDLKNLTGILSADRIEKLSQFGVVNLEQINQLTLSQLNNIGLTINEISEIQLNARNMARIGMGSEPAPGATANSLSATQDVDMRFLPSCLPLTTTTITTSTVTSEKQINDMNLSSPDPMPLSAGMGGGMITAAVTSQQQSGSTSSGGIDYSQYLRDSNLGFDKNDLLDDEKDEEQLVIDDQDLDALDDNSPIIDSAAKDESENDSKSSISYLYGGNESNDSRGLKDPPNHYTATMALLKGNETSKSDGEKPKPSTSSAFEGNFYGSTSSSSSKRRDTDTREDYRDPRLSDNRDDFNHDSRRHDKREDYRDPRLSSRSSSSAAMQWRPSTHYRLNNSDDDDSDESRSQSPILAPLGQQAENAAPAYDRQSMYDWTPRCLQEDIEHSRTTKADKDMRLSRFVDSSNSDIDLRLPFQPVKNIQIAKEIDASMSTLMPVPYKIYEIDVPEPKYNDLRHSFQGEDSTDPRIRRILGLPELSNSKVLAALSRSSRPTIASPSSVESASSPTREKEKPSTSAASPAPSVRGPRIDPRRAAAASATITSSGSAQNPPLPAGNPQQNVEIRMHLQKSEWYKNLNSKYKIMVNQQLALVSTELKRFHQDPSPNKVFDIQFILNNQNLQQILSNLGIYIDDNGQVAHIDSENDMMGGMSSGMDYGQGSSQMMMNDPNMTIQQRMQMQQQMGFLRRPPPNMNMMNIGGNGPLVGQSSGSSQGIFSGAGGAGGGGMMPPYGRNARSGLLGVQPNNTGSGGNFNPFGGNSVDNGNMMEQNFCGPNNPFSNNYGANGGGGNFGGQQMSRGNRNNFNRSGGGMNNRMNQNRRAYKSNNSRDRRGGGGGGGGGNGMGGGGGGAGCSSSAAGASDDTEDNWDNSM